MSTYKGDSPGKAVTRNRMWVHILRLMHLLDLPKRGAVVLAGEGGDISCLKAMAGLDIHAVDLDKEALDKVSRKYEVPCYHGEVGEVSASLDYNVAHLDFCGRLSVSTLHTVMDVVRNMNGKGLMAITLLKGREARGGKKRDLWRGSSRRARRNVLMDVRKSPHEIYRRVGEHLLTMKDGPNFDPIKLIKMSGQRYKDHWIKSAPTGEVDHFALTPKGGVPPLGKALIRMEVLKMCCEILLMVEGMEHPYLHVGSTWCYHSRTERDHGTPFFTSVVAVGFHVPKIVQMKELRFDSCDAKRSLMQLKNIICNAHPDVKADRLADMFKVNVGTVKAWKAHHTMGRYSFEEPPCVSICLLKEKDTTDSFNMESEWGCMGLAEAKHPNKEMSKTKEWQAWRVTDLEELRRARECLKAITL